MFRNLSVFTVPRECWLLGGSAIAKRDAQTRCTSVVGADKARWWTIIPVAVQGEIPVELAPELDVIGSV